MTDMVLKGRMTVKQSEARFVRALSRGHGIGEAREIAGLTHDQAERLATSSAVMVAVAAQISNRIHVELTGRAVDLLADLMQGRVSNTNIDGTISHHIVKPEVQLAAAQAILRIAKLEELPRPGAFGEADLSALTPDQLRAFIDQAKEAEARLGDMAQQVHDAPNAPSVARDSGVPPNPFNMLD
jgi:hypothetical protein